jgi:transposase
MEAQAWCISESICTARAVVTALAEDGTVVLSRRVASRPEDFQRVFGELEARSLSVTFEATYGWSWFADLLADAGIEAHMAHPLGTKAIAAGRVKNDSVDARTLAHLLRTNRLPEAWIAPPRVREHRRLVRTRTSLVRIRSRLQCQVHAILADHCVQPPVDSIFGPAGRRFLASVALPAVDRGRVDAALRLMDAITSEVIALDKELRAAFAGDERIHRLLPIPGIGFFTAAVVLAEVGDLSRFSSPDQLASWAGLTPTERSSDEHTRRGHISKQGSRWLRWVMVEAASRPFRDPTLRRFEEGIARRRGKKIGRVALARRLLTPCFYALRDQGAAAPSPYAHAHHGRSAQARSLGVMASPPGTAARTD